MARKKPRKPKLQVDAGDLAHNAGTHFEQCRYKEAMADYKRLLEQEPENAQWLERLLQCYRLRALELSNKGMYREAAVIWENYKGRAPQHFSQNSENLEAYINCLLSTRQFEKIAAFYRDRESVALQLSCHSRAFSSLALQLLVGNKNCEKQLQITSGEDTEPSAVRKLLYHRKIALTALQAFCGKDDRLLEESLGTIPFRSPYRDLAQILKALKANESDPGAEALQPLRRIKTDSAFYSLASTLFDCYQSPRQAIDIVVSQPPGRQVLLCELLGLPKDTLKLLRRAKPCLEHRQPKAVLELLLANQQLLSPAERQSLCLDLIPYHPKGYKLYAKQFGALSRDQLFLLAARTGRAGNDAAQEYEALLDWVRERIELEPRPLAAAIYRRLAELAGKLEIEFWDLPVSQTEALEASLEYDDSHKPGYFSLIELYARENNPRQRQHWIDKAIKRFPDDREFLTLAIDAAVDKGTYKKAVGLAKTLLKSDPLNQQAKSALVASHLNHARKQLRAGKYHLVNKELEGALAVDTRHHRHNIVMLQALLAHRQGELEQAGQVFEQWTVKSGNAFLDRVVLHWEALSVYGAKSNKKSGEAATVSRSIAEYGGTPNTPATSAVPESIRFLRAAQKWDAEAVNATVDHYAKELKSFGKSLRDHGDLLLCCEFFYEIRAYTLLKDYSSFATKVRSNDPLFAFYAIWAKVQGNCFRLGAKDADRLQALIQQADEAGQERLKTMIVDFLDNDQPFLPVPNRHSERQLMEQMSELMETIEELVFASPAESERILSSLSPMERQMLEDMMESLPPLEPDLIPLPGGKKQRRKKTRSGKGKPRSQQLPLEY